MKISNSLQSPMMGHGAITLPPGLTDSVDSGCSRPASINAASPLEVVERFRILLVAKNACERQLMCDTLSQNIGFTAVYTGASHGELALQILERQAVNMIIFSHDVDDMSILGFMGRLSHKQGKSRFPVVSVLNVGTEEVGLKAMKMGAYAYLPKGLNGEYFELLPMLASRIHTEQQMLAAMQVSGSRQQMLLENFPAAVYTISLQGGPHYIHVSPQISELGLSEELWGNDAELHHCMCLEEDRPLVKQALEHSFVTGTDFHCEYRIKTAGDSLRWFHDSAKVVMDNNGYPLFLRGVMTSINYIKSLESELARYRFMLDKMVCEQTRRLNQRLAVLESCNAALSDNYHKMRQMYLDLWNQGQVRDAGLCGTA